MLHFFRKYQKIFFIIVTAAIVISFTFFGTYNAMTQDEKAPDTVVGTTTDGSPIWASERNAMVRFLESSAMDLCLLQKGRMPNLLNDGIIANDFLKTGMGALLAESFFDSIQGDFEARIQKAKNFRPYRHPRAASVSAETVWMYLLPELVENIQKIKSQEKPSLETFHLLSQMYLDQLQLPPHSLRQILAYQQSQNQIGADPGLQNADLNLFGFLTMDDWFGSRFVELVAESIIDIAKIATKKGYRVTNEEVRAVFQKSLNENIEPLVKAKALPQISLHEAERYLGLDEYAALDVGRNILLFRRYLDEAGSSVFLDPLMHEQFDRYAKRGASVELYQLPDELHLRDFHSLMKFQVYLEATAPNPGKHRKALLSLPKKFFTADEVERKYPELIERKMRLEVAEISKDELALAISLKDTWDWQLKGANWDLLKNQFPSLSQETASSEEERFQVLDHLDPKTRLEIDQFARREMINTDEQSLNLALSQAKTRTLEIGLRQKGSKLSLTGISDPTLLFSLLQIAPIKGEENVSAPAQDAQAKLSFFSGDGNTYYRFAVLERDAQKAILTFKEAASDGTLDAILDKKLQDSYLDVKKRNPVPFRTENNGWKPWNEVKDAIGAEVFADVLKAISDKPETNFEVYAKQRFQAHLSEAKEHLVKNPEDAAWVLPTDKKGAELADQWLLEKKSEVVERSSRTSLPKEEILAMEEGNWSSLLTLDNGNICFFRHMGLTKGSEMSSREVQEGQRLLSNEARCSVMRDWLQEKKK